MPSAALIHPNGPPVNWAVRLLISLDLRNAPITISSTGKTGRIQYNATVASKAIIYPVVRLPGVQHSYAITLLRGLL